MRHRAIIDAGKTGSISRKQALSAALAAKTAQTASSREAPTSTWKGKRLPQTSSAVWERFLGQFGVMTPALVVDGKMKLSGKVPSVGESRRCRPDGLARMKHVNQNGA